MRSEIVHHHDVPVRQRRTEHLVDENPKDLAVGRALNGHESLQTLAPQRAQDCDISPIVLRHAAHRALPAWGATIQGSQGKIHPRFIHKLQTLTLKALALFPVHAPGLLHLGSIALTGV